MMNGIRTGWSDIDRAFAEMDSFRREVDRAFGLDRAGRRPVTWANRVSGPEADVYDAGDALVIAVDVPGLDPEALDLQVTATGLTLTAKRPVDVPEGYQAHRRERRGFELTRTFTLPVKVDVENTTAELKNGVLTIRLPKAAEVQPRKITVQS